MAEATDVVPTIYIVPKEKTTSTTQGLDYNSMQSTNDAFRKQFVTNAANTATMLPKADEDPEPIKIDIDGSSFEVDFELNENNFFKQLFDFYTIGGWESIINIEEQLFSNFLKDPSQFSANKKRLEIFLSSRDVLTSVIYKKMKALEIKAISKAAKQQVKAREILNIELNKYQITPVLKEREEHDENGVPHKVMVTTYVFKHPTNLEALKGLLPLLFEVSAEIKKYNHSLSGSKSELKALNSEQKNKTAQKNITGPAYDRTKKRITENIEKLKRRILEKQAQLANLLFNARMQNHPVCAIVIHLLNEKNYKTDLENILGSFIIQQIENLEAITNKPVLDTLKFDIFNPGRGLEYLVAKEVAGTDNPFAIDTLLFSLFNNEKDAVVEKGSYEYIVLNAYIMALLKKNEEIRKKRQTIEEVLSVTARIVSGISIIAWIAPPLGLVSVTFDLILLSATMGHLFYSASVFDKDLKNTVAQSAASSPADFYDNLSETAECLKNRPDILKELFVTATFMTLGPLLSKVSKLGEEALVTYGYYDDLKTIAEIQD